jgi:hypothetical protein
LSTQFAGHSAGEDEAGAYCLKPPGRLAGAASTAAFSGLKILFFCKKVRINLESLPTFCE